jgi:hypothetical protein
MADYPVTVIECKRFVGRPAIGGHDVQTARLASPVALPVFVHKWVMEERVYAARTSIAGYLRQLIYQDWNANRKDGECSSELSR